MHAENIGFIGLGHMGYPMAVNLAKAKLPLFVYNRTPQKASRFCDYHPATHCGSIDELVQNTSVIFTMLTSDEAVLDVYRQISGQNIKGKLFIDMSTISVATSLEIRDMIALKGGDFIDAPVSGSTGPAADGALLIMAGGEQSAVKRARPYLKIMGKTVRHLGPNGQGLAAKIAVNYYLATLYAALAETVLFADKSGLARKDILEIINESACGSAATRVKTPMLIKEDFAPAFALDLMVKDILPARASGADYPVGSAAVSSYLEAQAAGLGRQDVMGIINFLKGL